MDSVNFTQGLFVQVWNKFTKATRSIAGFMHSTKLSGHYSIEHRDKADNLIGIYPIPNGIVDVGKVSLLDVYFRNQAQIATWYFGLVNNAAFSAFAAADTMASHSGWAEMVGYDEATRVAWAPDAAAANSISNTTAATFAINAAATLKGIFVSSSSTKSGTSGTLWSTAAFAATVDVSNGDSLKLTYTVNA
jgi:hypothetical protein